MFWLGLITSIAFCPLFQQGTTSPRWAVLAVGVPWLLYNSYPLRWGPVHTVLASFIAVAAISLLWAPSFYDGMAALGVLVLLGGAFLLADEYGSRHLFLGLGVGIAINSGFALAQHFGWSPWQEAAPPGGLFSNRNVLAELAALTLIGLVVHRYWLLVPFSVLAMCLSWSRTAWLALAAAFLLWLWNVNRWATAALVVVLLASAPFVLKLQPSSSAQRLSIWTDTVKAMTVMGAGIGSFQGNFPAFASWPTVEERPDEVHNDYLQVAYELGAPGAMLFSLFLALIIWTSAPERYVLIALLTEMFLAFPLHLPATVLVFGLVAGRCAVDGRLLRRHFSGVRKPERSCPAHLEPGIIEPCGYAPSVERHDAKDPGAAGADDAGSRARVAYHDAEFNRWSIAFRSELERSVACPPSYASTNWGFRRAGD